MELTGPGIIAASGAVTAAVAGIFTAINRYMFITRKDCERKHDKHEKSTLAMAERLSQDEDLYLTEKLHARICGENTMTLRLHISEELKAMKAEIIKEIRNGNDKK
jgi:predicted class III extradiol MEMO1 family dioxygenase